MNNVGTWGYRDIKQFLILIKVFRGRGLPLIKDGPQK